MLHSDSALELKVNFENENSNIYKVQFLTAVRHTFQFFLLFLSGSVYRIGRENESKCYNHTKASPCGNIYCKRECLN